MNMFFKDETLFLNLIGNTELDEIEYIKNKLYSVLDQYQIKNVVVSTKDLFSKNRGIINSLRLDYYKHYDGKFTIINNE